MVMSIVYQYLLSWLPQQIVHVLLGLVGLLIVLMILHIVKIVLDSLPFL